MEPIKFSITLDGLESKKNHFTFKLTAELSKVKLDAFSNIEVMIDFISTVEKAFKDKIKETEYLSDHERKECKIILYDKLTEKVRNHPNIAEIVKLIKSTILKFFSQEKHFSAEMINREKDELFDKLSEGDNSKEADLFRFVRMKTKELYDSLREELKVRFNTHYFPKVLLRDYKLKLRQRLLKLFLPEMRARLFTEDMQNDKDYNAVQTQVSEIFLDKELPFSRISPEKQYLFVKLVEESTLKYISDRKQDKIERQESEEFYDCLLEYTNNREKSDIGLKKVSKEDLVNFYISANYLLLNRASKKGIFREIILMTVKAISVEKSSIYMNIEKLYKVVEKLCFVFKPCEPKRTIDFLEILSTLKKALYPDLFDRLESFIGKIPMVLEKKTSFYDTTKDLFNSLIFPKYEQDITMNPAEIKLLPYEEKNFSINATILVSGFVSSKDDFKITWENFIMDFDNFSEFYFFLWDSKTHYHMVRNIVNQVGALGMTLLTRNFFNALVSWNTYLTHNNIFNKTRVMSKYGGVILAYMIASEAFFTGRTITLVGFSQGSALIKYCLKELHFLSGIYPELKGKVQNVVLMGAANTFKNKKKWAEIFRLVSGRIVNCYSGTDGVLKKVYVHLDSEDAVGIGPLDLGPGVPVENYDYSVFSFGHDDYRDYMNEIIKDVNIF